MKQSTFTLYFFTLGILFIILEHFTPGIPALIVKAMLMPSLMVFYYSVSKKGISGFHRIILIGLFFACIGDVLLHLSHSGIAPWFEPESYFLFGLGAFLVTQLCYTLAFSLPKGIHKIFTTRIYQLLLILLYGGLLICLLYNRLGDFRIPVIVYAVVILSMLAAALNRYGKVNGLSFMLVSLGALLFVASDSMIAINKFYEKFDFARILIMATYLLGQYLIATGSLRQDFAKEDSAS
jgi:uncharacterized membrane protein YhhN